MTKKRGRPSHGFKAGDVVWVTDMSHNVHRGVVRERGDTHLLRDDWLHACVYVRRDDDPPGAHPHGYVAYCDERCLAYVFRTRKACQQKAIYTRLGLSAKLFDGDRPLWYYLLVHAVAQMRQKGEPCHTKKPRARTKSATKSGSPRRPKSGGGTRRRAAS